MKDKNCTDAEADASMVQAALFKDLLPFMARFLLVLVLLAGVYFFHGFLAPALMALVIGVSTWPIYSRLLNYVNGSTAWGASIAILLIVAFIVVPLSILMVYLIEESGLWLNWAVEANHYGAPPPPWLADIPMVGETLQKHWGQHIGKPGALQELFGAVSGESIATIYHGVIAASGTILHLLLTAVFMLITLFFIYKDGVYFSHQLDHLGEVLFPARWFRFSRLVPAAIQATVVGMGVIAIAEGIILGVAYWIVGVPYPILFGALTGFMALIPGGAPLSFTLVSLYLVGSGSATAGLGLFIWGSFELFMVDKFVRPKLVGGPIKLPFLPTFFGLVGGVKTMGFLGLFIGPVLMALIVALWREWLRELGYVPSREISKEAKIKSDSKT